MAALLCIFLTALLALPFFSSGSSTRRFRRDFASTRVQSSFRTTPKLRELVPDVQDNDSISVFWNNVLLSTIRMNHYGPTIVARGISIMHTCIYEAAAQYDYEAVPWKASLERRPEIERTKENIRMTASFAARLALIDIFPQNKTYFDQVFHELGYDLRDAHTVDSHPGAFGEKACREFLEFRHQDGSNQIGTPPYSDNSNYVGKNSADQLNNKFFWQPLKVPIAGNLTVQKYLTPHWGNVKPFSLSRGSDLRPKFKVSEDQFERDCRELIKIQADLDDYTKAVAEYWADGPKSVLPPGHWTIFATFTSRKYKHNDMDDIFMHLLLGNALMDASIVAWDSKRAYESVRPITAIHTLGNETIKGWAGPGKGIREIKASEWQPYQALNFVTPPFPEFLSGHSTFSAAAATVLRMFTGSDEFGFAHVVPKGWSLTEPGLSPSRDIPLYWNTFTDAANQAGISRLYGGIHFRAGDLEGRKAGKRVGEMVFFKALSLFNGRNVA